MIMRNDSDQEIRITERRQAVLVASKISASHEHTEVLTRLKVNVGNRK